MHGTYLKVVPYSWGWFNDGESSLTLYLWPSAKADGFDRVTSGTFAFLGEWRGYEVSIALGTWKHEFDGLAPQYVPTGPDGHGDTGSVVVLTGVGRHLSMDRRPFDNNWRNFQRTFRVVMSHFSPTLQAEDEYKGWSLLGWKGPFSYVGERQFISPASTGLPTSMEEFQKLASDIIKKFVDVGPAEESADVG